MNSVVLQALDARVRVVAPGPIAALFTELFGDIIAEDIGDHGNGNGNGNGNERDPVDAEVVWSPVGELWQVSATDGSAVADIAGSLADSIMSINRAAATSVAATHTVLHAGAFEVAGSAIAVTGLSGAGKSTLTAAALLAGHGYLADEVTAIDAVGHVRPYHRPIGLRSAGAASLGLEIPVHPFVPFTEIYPLRASLHGRRAGAAPLRLVAFVHRRPGPVEITHVSPADALVQLTSLSLGTDGCERVMFRRLDRLVRDVQIVTVGFQDSAAAVDALADFVR